MSDYPSIKPEDVREGDVVEVASTITADGLGMMAIRQTATLGATLRLVSRPAPPEPTFAADVRCRNCEHMFGNHTESAYGCTGFACPCPCPEFDGGPTLAAPSPEPPLRVGDFVRDPQDRERQITGVVPHHAEDRGFTRIEPPVGWPVGVPDEDGGTRWYVGTVMGYYYRLGGSERTSWADLLAAGGVPALAVTR